MHELYMSSWVVLNWPVRQQPSPWDACVISIWLCPVTYLCYFRCLCYKITYGGYPFTYSFGHAVVLGPLREYLRWSYLFDWSLIKTPNHNVQVNCTGWQYVEHSDVIPHCFWRIPWYLLTFTEEPRWIFDSIFLDSSLCASLSLICSL